MFDGLQDDLAEQRKCSKGISCGKERLFMHERGDFPIDQRCIDRRYL